MNINIKIDGMRELEEAKRNLDPTNKQHRKRIETKAKVEQFLVDILNDVIYPILTDKFENEGATKHSPPWLELSDKTQRRREKGWGYYRASSSEGVAHKVLHWTNRLMESVTDPNNPEAEFDINTKAGKYGGDEVLIKVGTKVPYAEAHQGAKGSNRVPKRKIFVAEDYRDDVYEYIYKKIRVREGMGIVGYLTGLQF